MIFEVQATKTYSEVNLYMNILRNFPTIINHVTTDKRHECYRILR